MTDQYDIAIIGAGPAGYVAAIRAAQAGLKTVCIDKRATLGGTCLNVGCIPSKALLQSTELLDQLHRQANDFGLNIADIRVDFAHMMKRKESIVSSLTSGIDYLFKKNNVTFIQGDAEFVEPMQLRIAHKETSTEIQASKVVIATGSEPIELPEFPFDEKQILSSTGILSLKQIPQKLVVIGAGVIGVELASVYRRLGSEVILVELLDKFFPSLDEDLSKCFLKSLKQQGMDIRLGAKVLTHVKQPNEVILTTEQNGKLENISASHVLIAVGRRPYTKKLGLENARIKADSRGFIEVNHFFQTSQTTVYAIGDAIKGMMLAHRASAEAIALIDSLTDRHQPVNYLAIPNVIYTHPEVASVGLTENEVKEAKIDILVGMHYFKANARARCASDIEGFVKVIGDKHSKRVLGMHIIGAHASELIAEGMLALQNKATLNDLANAPQAHPTLSESIKEAALAALGKALH